MQQIELGQASSVASAVMNPPWETEKNMGQCFFLSHFLEEKSKKMSQKRSKMDGKWSKIVRNGLLTICNPFWTVFATFFSTFPPKKWKTKKTLIWGYPRKWDQWRWIVPRISIFWIDWSFAGVIAGRLKTSCAPHRSHRDHQWEIFHPAVWNPPAEENRWGVLLGNFCPAAETEKKIK